MLAAKQFDIIMGMDIHLTVIAPGVIVPMPTPFVGMVFDPTAWLPFIGTTVNINGIPAATAGTMGKPVPFHIPIGLSFGPPPPANEATIFMGSATVVVNGEPMSRAGAPVLSCQSFGMPAPIRKGKSKAKSLFLPTSVVIPNPSGAPVMIGGPLTINVVGLLTGMAIGRAVGVLARKGRSCLGRFARAAKKSGPGRKARRGIQKIGDHASSKAANLRNKLKAAKCKWFGEPVDGATGRVWDQQSDFELPGPIPLIWERDWHSTSEYVGPLGHGWHHAYDLRLNRSAYGEVSLRLADGRLAFFPDLAEGGQAYLVQEQLKLERKGKRYLVTDADDLVYAFNQSDVWSGPPAPLRSISRSGAQVLFSYGKNDCLTGIVDSQGRELRVHNDAFGRIEKIDAPHPTKEEHRQTLVSYAYDENGNLAVIRDALHYPAYLKYAGHLLIQKTTRNGINFYWEYDAPDITGYCIRAWGDDGLYDYRFSYDKTNRITYVTDSRGFRSTYEFDEDGLLLRSTDPLGQQQTFVYDGATNLMRETNEVGVTTAYDYDENGNLSRIIHPDGIVEVLEYQNNKLTKALDRAGESWFWTYNGDGQLTKRLNPLGEATNYQYDGPFLTSVSDANSNETKLIYDDTGHLTEIHGPDGTIDNYTHDKLGRLIHTSDHKGQQRTLFYNGRGNVVEVHEPDGNIRKAEYDPSGNVTLLADKQRVVQMEYKGLGKLAARIENGKRVEFKYDTEENLVGVINEHGYAYRFERDPLGRVISEASFDGKRRSYRRDPAGRVTQILRPDRAYTKFTYNALGQTTNVDYADGSGESYTYDIRGAVAGAVNWDRRRTKREVRFHRDALGRVIRETSNGCTIDSQYDALGNRIAIKSSLGTNVRIDRDQLGRVKDLNASGADRSDWSAQFGHNEVGLEIDRQLPGNVRTKTQRDKLGRPTAQSVNIGFQQNYQRTYRWGLDDRLKEISIAGRMTSFQFEHDPVGNLAAVTYPNLERDFRMPDAMGNLFRSEDQKDRYYGSAGQLLRSGATTYAYDAEGNLSGKRQPNGANWSYHWNAAGFLDEVDRPDGRKVTFTYDALGRRLSKTYNHQRTCWAWDGNVVLHEWTEDAATPPPPKTVFNEFGLEVPAPPRRTAPALTTYLFEPDTFAPLAQLTPEADFSVICDYLGTPILAYDGDGHRRWSRELDIYGGVFTEEAAGEVDVPFRYPGQYFDRETGLCYNRFRYYDPAEGLYISVDPIGLAGGNPTLYGYVSDVNSLTDILGLSSIKFLFRGERSSMTPQKAFSEGFKPKGTHNDLLLHTTSNTTPGNFVSSSSKFEIAEGFSGKNGYLYEIDTPNGIDVNKTLGKKSPFPEQFEHAIKGGVKGSEIKGAHKLTRGKVTGEFVTNPNYKPSIPNCKD